MTLHPNEIPRPEGRIEVLPKGLAACFPRNLTSSRVPLPEEFREVIRAACAGRTYNPNQQINPEYQV